MPDDDDSKWGERVLGVVLVGCFSALCIAGTWKLIEWIF